jgi:predicted RNA polymerase sigma factor
MTTSHGADAGDIEGRVVEWVHAALATTDTAESVGVHAAARRAAGLPDDGLEVRPEGWTVEVVLRFAEADRDRSGDVLERIAEATGTVTLDGGDAAEIEWPAEAGGLRVDETSDAPGDKPLRCVVPVYVSVPWPSRNDAAAGSA